MKSKHICKRWFSHRGWRVCEYCGRQEWKVTRHNAEGTVIYAWERDMSLKAFADKWLPAVSGTNPIDLMKIDVAFPFEWNCYESWNVVWRVTFDFSAIRSGPATDTPVGTIMHGWTSKYQECFNRINAEAEEYYAARAGAPYRIGDNTYGEMRRFIQA